MGSLIIAVCNLSISIILHLRLQQNTHMEALEDGVELHTRPTRLPPPLRDTSVSGEACALFFLLIIIQIKLLKNIQEYVYESESYVLT